jgi:hypothetical protein
VKLRDLVHQDLVGGTLVEYKDNCGFDLEFGRATITRVAVEGEMFLIETDNEEAYMTQNISPVVEAMGYRSEVQRQGDVYLIRSSMGWGYALAKKGVDIPKRPHWLEVSDKDYEDTIRRTVVGPQ